MCRLVCIWSACYSRRSGRLRLLGSCQIADGGFRFAYRLTQRLDVDGMQTLGALNDLELHRLSGLERAISIHLDGRIMGEEVFVTSFRDDEAIPLGIIEPFDLADLHAAFSSAVPKHNQRPIHLSVYRARLLHFLTVDHFKSSWVLASCVPAHILPVA